MPQSKPSHVVRGRHALFHLADLKESGLARHQEVCRQCQGGAPVDCEALQRDDDGLRALEYGLVGTPPDGGETRHPVRRRIGVEGLEVEAGAERAVGAPEQYGLDAVVGIGTPDRRRKLLPEGTVDRVPTLRAVQDDLRPTPVIEELHYRHRMPVDRPIDTAAYPPLPPIHNPGAARR